MPCPTAAGLKPTNPKDIIGSNKVPMSMVPETALAYAALGLLEGALKYGTVNWRHTGVRASVYLDAMARHVAKWRNGEECDPQTRVPHLGNALACLCILIDAQACGKLTDDRPIPAPTAETIDRLSSVVAHLREIFAECRPQHYTRAAMATQTTGAEPV